MGTGPSRDFHSAKGISKSDEKSNVVDLKGSAVALGLATQGSSDAVLNSYRNGLWQLAGPSIVDGALSKEATVETILSDAKKKAKASQMVQYNTEIVVESPHPYNNNMNEKYEVIIPGSSELQLEFDSECKCESGCDYLDMFPTAERREEDRIERYSGRPSDNHNWPSKPFTIQGDRVFFTFTSDSSSNDWGWRITVRGKKFIAPEEDDGESGQNLATRAFVRTVISLLRCQIRTTPELHDEIMENYSSLLGLAKPGSLVDIYGVSLTSLGEFQDYLVSTLETAKDEAARTKILVLLSGLAIARGSQQDLLKLLGKLGSDRSLPVAEYLNNWLDKRTPTSPELSTLNPKDSKAASLPLGKWLPEGADAKDGFSWTSDGSYIYAVGGGMLVKVGSGLNLTTAGKVYAQTGCFTKNVRLYSVAGGVLAFGLPEHGQVSWLDPVTLAATSSLPEKLSSRCGVLCTDGIRLYNVEAKIPKKKGSEEEGAGGEGGQGAGEGEGEGEGEAPGGEGSAPPPDDGAGVGPSEPADACPPPASTGTAGPAPKDEAFYGITVSMFEPSKDDSDWSSKAVGTVELPFEEWMAGWSTGGDESEDDTNRSSHHPCALVELPGEVAENQTCINCSTGTSPRWFICDSHASGVCEMCFVSSRVDASGANRSLPWTNGTEMVFAVNATAVIEYGGPGCKYSPGASFVRASLVAGTAAIPVERSDTTGPKCEYDVVNNITWAESGGELHGHPNPGLLRPDNPAHFTVQMRNQGFAALARAKGNSMPENEVQLTVLSLLDDYAGPMCRPRFRCVTDPEEFAERRAFMYELDDDAFPVFLDALRVANDAVEGSLSQSSLYRLVVVLRIVRANMQQLAAFERKGARYGLTEDVAAQYKSLLGKLVDLDDPADTSLLDCVATVREEALALLSGVGFSLLYPSAKDQCDLFLELLVEEASLSSGRLALFNSLASTSASNFIALAGDPDNYEATAVLLQNLSNQVHKSAMAAMAKVAALNVADLGTPEGVASGRAAVGGPSPVLNLLCDAVRAVQGAKDEAGRLMPTKLACLERVLAQAKELADVTPTKAADGKVVCPHAALAADVFFEWFGVVLLVFTTGAVEHVSVAGFAKRFSKKLADTLVSVESVVKAQLEPPPQEIKVVMYETAHPYTPSMHQTSNYEFPGAAYVKFTFERAETENGCDYLTVTDNGGTTRQFTGMSASDWPETTFEGPNIELLFHSDGSREDWGVKLKMSGVPAIKTDIFTMKTVLSRCAVKSTCALLDVPTASSNPERDWLSSPVFSAGVFPGDMHASPLENSLIENTGRGKELFERCMKIGETPPEILKDDSVHQMLRESFACFLHHRRSTAAADAFVDSQQAALPLSLDTPWKEACGVVTWAQKTRGAGAGEDGAPAPTGVADFKQISARIASRTALLLKLRPAHQPQASPKTKKSVGSLATRRWHAAMQTARATNRLAIWKKHMSSGGKGAPKLRDHMAEITAEVNRFLKADGSISADNIGALLVTNGDHANLRAEGLATINMLMDSSPSAETLEEALLSVRISLASGPTFLTEGAERSVSARLVQEYKTLTEKAVTMLGSRASAKSDYLILALASTAMGKSLDKPASLDFVHKLLSFLAQSPSAGRARDATVYLLAAALCNTATKGAADDAETLIDAVIAAIDKSTDNPTLLCVLLSLVLVAMSAGSDRLRDHVAGQGFVDSMCNVLATAKDARVLIITMKLLRKLLLHVHEVREAYTFGGIERSFPRYLLDFAASFQSSTLPLRPSGDMDLPAVPTLDPSSSSAVGWEAVALLRTLQSSSVWRDGVNECLKAQMASVPKICAEVASQWDEANPSVSPALWSNCARCLAALDVLGGRTQGVVVGGKASNVAGTGVVVNNTGGQTEILLSTGVITVREAAAVPSADVVAMPLTVGLTFEDAQVVLKLARDTSSKNNALAVLYGTLTSVASGVVARIVEASDKLRAAFVANGALPELITSLSSKKLGSQAAAARVDLSAASVAFRACPDTEPISVVLDAGSLTTSTHANLDTKTFNWPTGAVFDGPIQPLYSITPSEKAVAKARKKADNAARAGAETGATQSVTHRFWRLSGPDLDTMDLRLMDSAFARVVKEDGDVPEATGGGDTRTFDYESAVEACYYSVIGEAKFITEWTLEGSADGAEWDVLDKQTEFQCPHQHSFGNTDKVCGYGVWRLGGDAFPSAQLAGTEYDDGATKLNARGYKAHKSDDTTHGAGEIWYCGRQPAHDEWKNRALSDSDEFSDDDVPLCLDCQPECGPNEGCCCIDCELLNVNLLHPTASSEGGVIETTKLEVASLEGMVALIPFSSGQDVASEALKAASAGAVALVVAATNADDYAAALEGATKIEGRIVGESPPPPFCPGCAKCMEWCGPGPDQDNTFYLHYECNGCAKDLAGGRWWCKECRNDYCDACHAGPAVVPTAVVQSGAWQEVYVRAGAAGLAKAGFRADNCVAAMRRKVSPNVSDFGLSSALNALNMADVPVPPKVKEMWVSKILSYSSQYDASSWQADNLCGPPRVYNESYNYGDIAGAWTHPSGSTDPQWIEFETAEEVRPTKVDIYETYNNGAVVKFSAWDGAGWVVLWQGSPQLNLPASARIFSPPLDAPVGLTTKKFRLDMNVAAISGFNEIDCVKITGLQGGDVAVDDNVDGDENEAEEEVDPQQQNKPLRTVGEGQTYIELEGASLDRAAKLARANTTPIPPIYPASTVCSKTVEEMRCKLADDANANHVQSVAYAIVSKFPVDKAGFGPQSLGAPAPLATFLLKVVGTCGPQRYLGMSPPEKAASKEAKLIDGVMALLTTLLPSGEWTDEQKEFGEALFKDCSKRFAQSEKRRGAALVVVRDALLPHLGRFDVSNMHLCLLAWVWSSERMATRLSLFAVLRDVLTHFAAQDGLPLAALPNDGIFAMYDALYKHMEDHIKPSQSLQTNYVQAIAEVLVAVEALRLKVKNLKGKKGKGDDAAPEKPSIDPVENGPTAMTSAHGAVSVRAETPYALLLTRVEAEDVEYTTQFDFFADKAISCLPNHQIAYFEVEVVEAASKDTIQVGLAVSNESEGMELGSSVGQIAYFDNGTVQSESTEAASLNGFEKGDIIGVGLNYVEGKVFFTRNGTLQKSQISDFDVNRPLFPVVAVEEPGQIKTNFGAEPNAHPFRYEPRLKYKISRKTNISCLKDLGELAVLGRALECQGVADMDMKLLESIYYSSPGREMMVETAHPYPDSADLDWSFVVPGVSNLTLTFDPLSSTEEGCDNLTIYTQADRQGTPVEWNGNSTFSGSNWPQTPIVVNSDRVYLYFHSDGSCSDWGFRVRIEAPPEVKAKSEFTPVTTQLAAMKDWSAAKDAALSSLLVKVSDDAQLSSPWRAAGLPAAVSAYLAKKPDALPEGCTKEGVTARVPLLQRFNVLVDTCLPYIDLSSHARNSMCGVVKANRAILHPGLTTNFLYSLLPRSNNEPSDVHISRHKASLAAEAKDVQGTIFGQIAEAFRESSVLNAAVNAQTQAWKTYFKGEGSVDAGGPYRECFTEMARELTLEGSILMPTPNMSLNCGSNRHCMIPRPTVTDDLLYYYEFLGVLIGATLKFKGAFEMSLSSVVWKQLVGLRPNIGDLEGMDLTLARVLDSIRDIDQTGVTAETFGDILFETFTTHLADGTEVELVPGGSSIDLTFDNRFEFCDLVEKVHMAAYDKQVAAMRKGMSKFLPVSVLATLFSWQQLRLLVCGPDTVDVELLKKNTEITGNAEAPHIKFLWEALESFENTDRSLFLRFVWGRSKLPLDSSGFSDRFKIHSHSKSPADAHLPEAHTCFFTLDLPAYSTVEILKEKVLFAIRNCTAIDADNDVVDRSDWA